MIEACREQGQTAVKLSFSEPQLKRLFSAVTGLQCFDAVGWVSGKASGL